jgi:hypothetical protein
MQRFAGDSVIVTERRRAWRAEAARVGSALTGGPDSPRRGAVLIGDLFRSPRRLSEGRRPRRGTRHPSKGRSNPDRRRRRRSPLRNAAPDAPSPPPCGARRRGRPRLHRPAPPPPVSGRISGPSFRIKDPRLCARYAARLRKRRLAWRSAAAIFRFSPFPPALRPSSRERSPDPFAASFIQVFKMFTQATRLPRPPGPATRTRRPASGKDADRLVFGSAEAFRASGRAPPGLAPPHASMVIFSVVPVS